MRADAQLKRARDAVEQAGLQSRVLDERVESAPGFVSISTMRLEFRSVVAMACDDEVIPLQERIETVADESDLQESTTSNASSSTSRARGPETIYWLRVETSLPSS